MMSKKMIELNKTISKHLQKIPDLLAIYIFGSVADGVDNAGSDIDVAFLAEDSLDDVARWNIAQELAINFQRDVDLIDLNNCSEVLRFQIVSKGQLIFAKNKKIVNQFADKSYWLYMDLQELKTTQYADIKERRAVYG
ncbi:MAG: nucleotidyltransferase domain-containing protein [Candidatus Thioglobus sp.]|nr:MAG: nucleotidyltransferase domain-containing protein [Candidatus Thioglobus sp.]KAA0448399.1 MAG: nucleotidyltransferase domain-containing protein [Candidatus Thioglobus sp.]